MVSKYIELSSKDYLEMLQPLFKSKMLYIPINSPDKIQPNIMTAIDEPWVHAGDNRDHCVLNHRILFDCIFKNFKPHYVPSYCQDCWKIVARPKTLKELWDICDFQQATGVLAKSGTENRKQVYGLYGAYWYTRSQAEGLELLEKLRNKIEVPLLLKRGCSEFEWICGDSSKWQVYPTQLIIENDIKELINTDDFYPPPQTELIKNHVRRKWIEFAYEHGDPTVYEFTGGEPLAPNYKTYEVEHEKLTS